MILNPSAGGPLQNKTVTPKTSSQTVQKDSGYYGLGTVTVAAYPNQSIEIAIVSLASGANIVYGSTTITTAGVLNASSGQPITINMPAPGATLYVDGAQYTITGTSATVTLFDDAIISMSGSSPYVVEVAQAQRIGGKVPTGYIYKAWRAWQLLKTAYPGFGYAWVLICDSTTETKFYFLESTFSFSGYSTSTKTMSATGFFVATYTKSGGTWATSHVASGGTATSIDLTDAVYTDVTFTSGGARVFPVAQGISGVDVSDTTATASDVLAGKYFYNAAGVKTLGSLALPQLNAPTISLNGDTLTISNPATNGNFVTGYKVYSDGSLVATIQATTLDLSTVISAAGTHSVTAKAYGTGFNDSAASTAVSYTVSAGYSVSIGPNATSVAYDENGYCVIDGTTYNFSNYGTGAVLASSASEVQFGSNWHLRSIEFTMGGVHYAWSDQQELYEPVTLTGDMVILSGTFTCLTGDTLVTMADGTEKRIDEIELGDEILSYDWDTMQLVPNKVIFTDKDENKTHTEYDVWAFDDGTVIKTVHRHEFYNVEACRMKYMDEWRIGEHAHKIDGTEPELIAHEVIKETVRHYKITGEKGTNYYANGLLNGDRDCPKNIVFGKEGA